MNAHTPGPWIPIFKSDERGADVLDANYACICNCYPEDVALIAAAPDLLAALRRLSEWCENSVPYFNDDVGNQAAVAIAKAEGRT